jgi:hypothetical protein
MTTLERDLEPLPWTAAPERPVFVAHDGRRARRLRLVATVVAVLALLWLAALGAGMLGFGSLPGIATPLTPFSHKKSDSKPVDRGLAPAVHGEYDAFTRAPVVAERDEPARAQETVLVPALVRAHKTSTPRASRRRTVTKPSPPPAAQPAQPAAARHGWARHGRLAPRGQARRTQPQPPPPAPRGQATAPGQAKKAVTPAPPPPLPENGHGGGSKKP